MQIRFFHKISALCLAIFIIVVLGMNFDRHALDKERRLSELTRILSDVAQNVYLQKSFLEQLTFSRANQNGEQETRQQITETTERIDTLFQRVQDEHYLSLVQIASLEDAWKKLKAPRLEYASGKELTKNRELSQRAYVAFEQELIARQKEVLEMVEATAARSFRNCVLRSCVVIVLLIAAGFLLWKNAVDTQRLATLIVARTPAQGNKLTFPDSRDIEDNLKTLDLQQRKQSEASDNFFADMSHEIRTPLNGIIGFLESLAETELSSQQKQFLNLIDASSKSLLHVINEILDYSKINAGKLTMENVAFDFASFLEDRGTFAQHLAKGKRNLKVSLDYDGPSPCIIRTDPMRLRQVIDNLTSNAVKFTERGDVTLAVKCVPLPDNNGVRIGITVKDTGIGMPRQMLEHIFAPYEQGGARTSRKYGGTGLGLAIANKLVAMLGGKLTVTSRPGEGTAFSFEFNAESAAKEEQLRLSGDFIVSLPQNELKKKYALLVDDTPTNLFLLETVCQSVGLPYLTASDGLEAVKLCQQERFDIIFMDIQMPVMDGYTAMKEIRNLPDTGTTHIIALTASAYQQDVARALESGANSFIPKPFERNQLLLCLADALSIEPVRKLREVPVSNETQEDETVRLMHDFMREQYRISLGEIKMILAQTASDWRPILDNLEVYAKKDKQDDVKAILHRLKGQLSSIGLLELADKSADIMEKINAGTQYADDVFSLIEALVSIFKALEKQVTIV